MCDDMGSMLCFVGIIIMGITGDLNRIIGNLKRIINLSIKE